MASAIPFLFQEDRMTIRKLSNMQELLEMFDSSVHDALRRLVQSGAEYIVVYENHDFWSSRFGQRVAVKVGYGCTYSSLEQAMKYKPTHYGDVPIAYLEIEDDETETA
jgi:hypothetical protein